MLGVKRGPPPKGEKSEECSLKSKRTADLGDKENRHRTIEARSGDGVAGESRQVWVREAG